MTAWMFGEAPTLPGVGRRPLDGRNGEMLAKLAGLDGYDDLADRFEIRNLLGDPQERQEDGKGYGFDAAKAKRVASAFRIAELEAGDSVVALGARVAGAFGIPSSPTLVRWIVIPHPSGIVRAWNEAELRAEVGRELRGIVEREEQR